MKPPIPFLALLLTTSTLLATPEERTAKAIKARAETLAGGEVSIEITHVASVRNASDETCSVFTAHTFDTGENIPAGTILVAARKEEHDTFVKKFGAVPEVGATRPVRNRETTRLTGTLRLTAKKIPYIDLTDGLADEELLSKVVTGGDAEARPDENRRKFKGSSKANRAAR